MKSPLGLYHEMQIEKPIRKSVGNQMSMLNAMDIYQVLILVGTYPWRLMVRANIY